MMMDDLKICIDCYTTAIDKIKVVIMYIGNDLSLNGTAIAYKTKMVAVVLKFFDQ
jgi:hypothetical protein